MLSSSLLYNTNQASITGLLDFRPSNNTRSEDKDLLNTMNSRRSFCAVKPFKFHSPNSQDTSNSLAETSKQSQSEPSQARTKILRNVILSLNPKLSPENLDTSCKFTKDQTNSEGDSSGSERTESPHLKHFDLQYNNNTFKYCNWEDVAKLPLAQAGLGRPMGAFYCFENEYFLYFNKHDEYQAVKGTKSPNFTEKLKLETTESQTTTECSAVSKLEDPSNASTMNLLTKLIDSDPFIIKNTSKNTGVRILLVESKSKILELIKKIVLQNLKTKNENTSQEGKSSLPGTLSRYTKNLPKKLGDQFICYLKTTCSIDISSILRDKTSWKALNSLMGENAIAWENTSIDSRVLMQKFIEFILQYDITNIDEARTRDEFTKLCYKLTVLSFKAAFHEILKSFNIEALSTISITKAWPNLEIQYVIRDHLRESEKEFADIVCN